MDERILKRRIEVLDNKMQKQLEEVGWIMHVVSSDEGVRANHHTHGLEDHLGHLDLQIVLNIDPEISRNIFGGIVEEIKKGKTYKSGKHSGVIESYDVQMLEFEESDRTILRIILPDPNGKFPDDEHCEKTYKTQNERQ